MWSAFVSALKIINSKGSQQLNDNYRVLSLAYSFPINVFMYKRQWNFLNKVILIYQSCNLVSLQNNENFYCCHYTKYYLTVKMNYVNITNFSLLSETKLLIYKFCVFFNCFININFWFKFCLEVTAVCWNNHNILKTEFLPSSGCINTTISMDTDKNEKRKKLGVDYTRML